MCSSRGLCGAGDRPPGRSSRSRGGGGGSGSHYALCALGVGLVALGIVMIVWTVIPKDGEESGASGNSSKPLSEGGDEDGPDNGGGDMDNTKTSSVAFVLVGVGLVMLLLSLCLGMRNKGRPAEGGGQQAAGAAARIAYQDETSGDSPDEPAVAYDVPTYEEVVGSDTYPVSNSNLRRSIAHLPSYEDILAAVENEGAADASEEGHAPSQGATSEGAASSPDGPDPPAAAAAAAAAATDPDPASSANPAVRSGSRVSRILRPLRVRRIKSDKLHLKAFRLQIRSPAHNPVTIEPITPPPQYDDKPPDLV